MGKDVERDYRFTRSKIGLVQQEINNDPFFKVREVVKLQGGYFGVDNLDRRVEDILKKVALWDKRDQIGRTHAFGAAHDGPELALIRFDPDDLPSASRDLL